MGVSGLLGLLKSIQKHTHLREFKGKTLGVDAYGWLHRGAVACAVELAQGKPTRKYIDFVMHRVRMLIYFGVKPYLVFDGDRLPSKANTETSRRENRAQSKKNGMELLRLGRIAQAQQELQKSVDITPEMARHIIEELKAIDVDYVVAPYEADSQMAYLEKMGIIDGIISEDSDLLVFGANCLLTKLDQYGECIMIRRDDYTSCVEVNLSGWTNHDLRRMAILNGCDYLQGIHKMGLKSAHRLVRKHKTVERIIRAVQLEAKFSVPPDYIDQFTQAEMTFLYQWVYCPRAKRLVNLTEPTNKGQLDGIEYIGKHLAPTIATAVARGDINPMTKQPIVIDTENRRSTRSSAERRAALKTEVPASSKKQGIDTFFKAKRIPLAELDPNLFKPTESQQRLLDQPQREWTAEVAPNRPPTNIQPVLAVSSRPPLRTVQSAPHGPKRKRLCTDDDDSVTGLLATTESFRSKFFASPAKGRNKKSGRSDFELWSDDSIIDAMASLPAENPPIHAQRKQSLQVYKDPDLLQKSVAPSTSQSGDIPGANGSNSKQSPFGSGPRLEVGALDMKVSTNTVSPAAESADEQVSTPTKTQNEAGIEHPFEEEEAVPDTIDRAPTRDKELMRQSDVRPSQRLVHASPSQSLTSPRIRRLRRFRFQGSTMLDVSNARGSEDMLIPDSDAASEGTEDFVGSSSPVQQNSDDEAGPQSPLQRLGHAASLPNLKQFSFGMTTTSLR